MHIYKENVVSLVSVMNLAFLKAPMGQVAKEKKKLNLTTSDI